MSAIKRDFKKLRETQSPEGDHNSNWAISYGDMVTLLLAFFVLFFSVSKTSHEIKIVDEALKKEFNVMTWPKPDSTWGAQNRFPTSEMTDFEGIKGLKTTAQGNKLIVEFPMVSFFNMGSYDVTAEGQSMLKKFGDVLNKFTGKMRIVVRGYTDNKPVKVVAGKAYKDNLELSALRAIAALRVLNNQGIPYHLLRIGGYGETDKAKVLSDKEVMKFDRKIVLVIEPLDNTERGLDGLYTAENKKKEEVIDKAKKYPTNNIEDVETREPSSQGGKQ